MSRRLEGWLWVLGTAGSLGAIIGSIWLFAYMEAATYNRLTGQEVSTWDALWVNLRVMGG